MSLTEILRWECRDFLPSKICGTERELHYIPGFPPSPVRASFCEARTGLPFFPPVFVPVSKMVRFPLTEKKSVAYNNESRSSGCLIFRVVEKYHSGDWNLERALKEIRAYPNYDQTAFVTQKAIDQRLTFSGYQEV